MQALGLIPPLLATALTAATLLSTVASLFGRARLQRSCAVYREELSQESLVSKEALEALHLKFVTQLMARDAYPARWTLTLAHAAVLFGVLWAAELARLVATQDAQLSEPAALVLIPAAVLFILPIVAVSFYRSVATKRADIRRTIAARAATPSQEEEPQMPQFSNTEFVAFWAVATAPNCATFFAVFMFILNGETFSGPAWVTVVMAAIFTGIFCLGGGLAWYQVPRTVERLEAWAIEPIPGYPTRPTEREDSDMEIRENLERALSAKEQKNASKTVDNGEWGNRSFILKRKR